MEMRQLGNVPFCPQSTWNVLAHVGPTDLWSSDELRGTLGYAGCIRCDARRCDGSCPDDGSCRGLDRQSSEPQLQGLQPLMIAYRR